VSFIAVRSVRFPAPAPVPAAETKPVWRTEFVAGLRMFAGNRFLVALLSIAVVAQLGTGAMNALDIFFLTDNLHAASKLLGVLSMAAGVGSVVGALLAGRIVKLINARNLTWLGLIVGGGLFCVYARQTSFIPGVILVFAFALPFTALNTGIGPLLLAATPTAYMGRMMAVFNPINMGASTLSVVVAGSLASTSLRTFHATIGGVHVGRIDTIFTVAGLLVVAAGVYAYFALPPTGTEGAGGEPSLPIAAQVPPETPVDHEVSCTFDGVSRD
jgi:Na+/melibiose symporter-like transporter